MGSTGGLSVQQQQPQQVAIVQQQQQADILPHHHQKHQVAAPQHQAALARQPASGEYRTRWLIEELQLRLSLAEESAAAAR